MTQRLLEFRDRLPLLRRSFALRFSPLNNDFLVFFLQYDDYPTIPGPGMDGMYGGPTATMHNNHHAAAAAAAMGYNNHHGGGGMGMASVPDVHKRDKDAIYG